MEKSPLTEFPDLAHLLGAYLNQDYDIYGPSIGDAVGAFVNDDPPEYVAATRNDIQRFLSMNASRLDETLDRLDPGRAHPPGMPALDYLLWLDQLLAEALSAKSVRAAE